ncbi:dihydrofolate reductase family protein [Nocardioides alcanivorans]|uniref:dihydrofolate reductase family protein n=1 Tax=Nocardioides alcanivorans TaxID=2897352 RepID=UPI001F304C4D|nr:dihydrofolate reductase family protein [Nocardioides alcanivorans]
MRLLLDAASQDKDLTADDVAERYPWPESGKWVRAMMVTTLDGAAVGPDGLSKSVTSAADQVVFNAVRRFADVVLVGAQTVRAEQYTPMTAKPEDAVRRAEAGQTPAPVIAVVTGSLELPWELPVWSGSTHRPIVLTHEGAVPERLARAREHADVLTLPVLSPDQIIDALVARGLRRIVTEGGPTLLRELIAADLVDEADITLSPGFSGTANSPATAMLSEVRGFRLEQVLEQDGFLMTRHLRAGAER